MKFFRPLLALVLLLIVVVAVWLWWSVPTRVDMAAYAPADAIVYVEFNNLEGVAQAIQHSDVWQAAVPITQSKPAAQNRLLRAVARAGIGPLPAVLFARAQVALVVVDLKTSEENDTLKVRPEVAIIAETHTSKWRTKSAAVDAVKQLANFAYGASMCAERSGDADYVECSVAGGERKIVGAVDGTLIVVGNSDNAVRTCLEVRRGVRPSIHTDPELLKVRATLASDNALGFGYISPANTAKLFSWVAPLLMGQAPGDQQLEQLLAVSAGKVLRGVAWTANPSPQGIEDRFLFSLEPGVVSRLQPAFETAERNPDFWKLVPQGFQSLTIYRNKAPATAWSSLDSAVAFKLDALPAVLFGSLLRSSLSVYGITNPKEVLATLNPPLLTLKPSAGAEGSIMVARVSDEARLKRSLTQEVFKDAKGEILEGLVSNPDPAKEFAAVFADGYVLLGKTENMRAGLVALRQKADDLKDLQHSAEESSAPIVTYANDEARLNNFILTLLKLQGRQLSNDEVAKLQNTLRSAGFASTETRLNAFGIERTTHSAFGQFSTFISLLQPEGPSR
ncbi:MAG TPA: hypothetical protein VGQ41_06835 [Pyrinomonadaceae bacterium]|jgi:hypothetical protein|nr:hypothetical protein [Pyrinomonadaceae bacterium]